MAETSINNSFKQVYISYPQVPFAFGFLPKSATVNYPFVEEAPDPNFKFPMYDWNNYRWFDTDGKVQGQKISEMADTLNKLKDDVANGKLSNEALNQQLGTLVGLVSQGAIAQQTSQPSTDDKADSTANSDGGDK